MVKTDRQTGVTGTVSRVLTGARVLAPSGDRWVQGSVRWVGGRITAVQADPRPAGLTEPTEDLGGRFLLPGLIDAHVHLCWDASADPAEHIAHQDDTLVALGALSRAQAMLRLGITTVRDLGSPRRTVLSVARAIRAGWLSGPEIWSAGSPITMTGGHIHEMGIEADGPDAVRRAARLLFKRGADLLKAAATGGIYTEGEEPGSPQLTLAELSAAADEAHRRGRRLAVHAEGREGVEAALDAGADTIEHAISADEASLRRMAAAGVAMVPTLVVMRRIAEASDTPAWAVEKARSVVGVHADTLAQAIRLGVTVVAGTDAGSPHTPGDTLFDELEAYVALGMSPAAALRSCTRAAGKALGRADLGTLSADAQADMIALDSDPLDDISALRRVARIWRAGVEVGV